MDMGSVCVPRLPTVSPALIPSSPLCAPWQMLGLTPWSHPSLVPRSRHHRELKSKGYVKRDKSVSCYSVPGSLAGPHQSLSLKQGHIAMETKK